MTLAAGAVQEPAAAGREQPLCQLARPLGRGTAADRAQREARAISREEGLIQPASCFRIHPVIERSGDLFRVAGGTLRIPRFAPYVAGVEALATAVCTIGAQLERRVSGLFAARRPFLALALDRLGTEELYRLSDRTLAAIRAEARALGLKAGEQANPGDPGIGLDQQATVLALADAASCGVSLTSAGMLSPRKSLSFVVALGRELKEQTVFGRCRRCPWRHRCPVR